MSSKRSFVRGILLASVLLVVVAGAGYSAPGGSQSVTVAAAAKIDITVPAAASIAATDPGACGTTSTSINVKSNKVWNLQIRSEPLGYPNGKAKSGLVEMTNAFQYKGGSVPTFTDIASIYANLAVGQAKTTGLGTNVAVDYQQCVDWADNPDTYTIVVEYLGVQP